ncbi:MAG: hypothetical protein GWP91_20435 [Rhodobacterales bacterium]|nr:hypothetical protein [Rhodobacterales bacterium]
MYHAPRHGGGLPKGIYHAHSEQLDLSKGTRALARSYWRQLTHHPDVSDHFKAIAAAQLAVC